MPESSGWAKVFIPWNVRPGRDQAWYDQIRADVPETEKMTPDLYMEQNYPTYEDEALRPTQANSFFSQEALASLMSETMEPKEIKAALVRIWKKPMVGRQYVAFADTAWGKTGSYSCMVVLDYRGREQVAEIYGRPSQDELSRAIYDLCNEYNRAFLGVEANAEGQTIVTNLVDMGYGYRMYHHADNWRREPRHRGWLTTGGVAGTRILMLSDLRQSIEQQQIVIRCREAVNEMMSFIRDEKGRLKAAEGAYDDHVMSWAGALQMLSHARVFNRDPKKGVISYAYS